MRRDLFILAITMLFPIFLSCSNENLPTSSTPKDDGNLDINGTLTIAAPGSLSTFIYNQKDTITTLALKGKIDARDIKYMRDSMPKLAVLDLSWADIKEYTGSNGTSTSTYYPEDQMPEYSFYNSVNPNKTLTTIILSVYSIGNYAFKSCTGLTTILNGASVGKIGTDAFYGCIKLPMSKTISVSNGGLYNALTSTELFTVNNLTITGTLDALDFATLRESMPSLSVLDISGVNILAYNGLGGTSTDTSYPAGELPNKSFSSDYRVKTYTEIKLPNSLTSIGADAFNSNTLKNLTIPNSVKSIGVGAFSNCQGLTTFMIPNSVASIGANAFEDCTGLTSITMGNSVTSIGSRAFRGCQGLSTFTIPNSVTFLGDRVFNNCTGLTSVTIGNSVTTISGYTFEGCTGLTGVTIPNSVTSLGNGAFFSCTGLNSATIPNSVTLIGDETFSNCTLLTDVTIGNSVASIGTQAFFACEELTSLTIGNSVTTIGEYAFGNCKNLASITSLNPAPPTLGLYCYKDDPAVKAVYVPAVNVDSYKAAVGWRDYFYSLIKEIPGN